MQMFAIFDGLYFQTGGSHDLESTVKIHNPADKYIRSLAWC